MKTWHLVVMCMACTFFGAAVVIVPFPKKSDAPKAESATDFVCTVNARETFRVENIDVSGCDDGACVIWTESTRYDYRQMPGEVCSAETYTLGGAQ